MKYSDNMGRRAAIGKIGSGILALSIMEVPIAQRAKPKTDRSIRLKNTQNRRSRASLNLGLDSAVKWSPGRIMERIVIKGSGRLQGRKALITGGDSGMGRAAAIAYAREGADVAINYLPEEEKDAKEVIALIKAAGRKAVAIPGDLRKEEFCIRLIEDAVLQLGGLDILVSNAARQQTKPSILDITTAEFDATMKTNIYAPFWLIKAALPHLKPGAVIIGTTSVQAADPSEDLYDYAQTKAATTNYIRSLAKQLGPKGIRVNGVAPGPIWTALQVSGGATQEKLVNFGGDTPMGRPGQPAELASIYVQLAAADASYANGQIYGAAGGGGQP